MTEQTSAEATNETSQITALARLADANVPAVGIKTEDGRFFIVYRDDFEVKETTAPNQAEVLTPKKITQAVRLQNVVSLIDYVNRFKDPSTVLFANIDTNTIKAVIDYHVATPGAGAEQPSTVAARLCQHSATLTLPFSQEWMTWTAIDNKLMSHIDFATFLEENAIDVTTPHGADLLELCRDLQVKSNVDFKTSVRMGDTTNISYQKDDDATTKDNIALPIQIEITIPVYFGEQAVKMSLWLRRKIDDGRLSLGFKIARKEAIRQMEFNRVVSEVEDGVTLTTVYGMDRG